MEYKKDIYVPLFHPLDLIVLGGETKPEQFEIGQLSRKQRKKPSEELNNYKSNKYVSSAECFEELAYTITAGACTARAEKILKSGAPDWTRRLNVKI